VSGRLHEATELAHGHERAIDPEPSDRLAADRRLLG
jgi:hypothetical protein